MNRFYVLIMRTVLGAVFAVIISRAFYPDKHPVYVAALGAFLVLMAYFFEYLRKKK